jgi:NAD(P)H-flavin reductase/ferredoxin
MFSFLRQKKGPFAAKIEPLGESITVRAGENLLKAALEKGIAWPYNCRVGSCGSCKCKLLSGKIKELNDFSYVLTGEELEAGYILACQTALKSDIEVAVQLEAGGALVKRAEPRRVKGRISRVEALTHDILDIGIELDGGLGEYLPGQYADIIVPGVIDEPRSYSFANSPHHEGDRNVSFFIRRVPNGRLTEWLHSGSRLGSDVVVDGPHGSFYLREPAGPLVLVAGGSGLAPIRALLQQIVADGHNADVSLIFGAREQRDLYCLEEIERLAGEMRGTLRFVPVLSHEQAGNGWNGATGLCPDSIMPEMLKVDSSHAYLCGPPAMVDAAVKRLKAIGLEESQIFFDKFLDASSILGGRPMNGTNAQARG